MSEAHRRFRWGRKVIQVCSVLGIAMLLFSAVYGAWRALPVWRQDRVRNLTWVRHVLYAVRNPEQYPRTSRELGDGGPAANATFLDPADIWVDRSGAVYVTDRRNNRIRWIVTDTVRTLAGTGFWGYSGDGIRSTDARFADAFGIWGSGRGDLYIADSNNHRVRVTDESGRIRSVAGTGRAGFSGDGGPAVTAELNEPVDVCLGPDGDLFIADLKNYRVRRVTTTGIIDTVVGDGTRGFAGDGGPATEASLDEVWGIFCAPDGRLFIADSGNNRVRVVGTDGIVQTVVGTGEQGYGGDGGPASRAILNSPQFLHVTEDGTLWVGDEHNHRVRRVGPNGLIETVAGTGMPGFSGDGGPAIDAQLHDPESVWVFDSGAFLIADGDNNRIRIVDTEGIIRTVYGGAPALPPLDG